MKKICYILLILIIATGCTSVSNTNNAKDEKILSCPEQRPDMCTMQYEPVCAYLVNSSQRTFSNACNACSDKNVSGYKPGQCEWYGSFQERKYPYHSKKEFSHV